MSNPEKFLLATLKLRAWSGRKFDRSETEDISERRKTHAARVNKQLPSDDWMAPLVAHDSLIRREFYRLTLATDVTSIRLLPEQARERFEQKIGNLLAMRADIVDTLIETYPGEIETAPQRLGDMFDASDFPSVDVLRSKYGAKVGYLPSPASWKMGVGNGKVAENADNTRAEMLETAYNDAWNRITDHLETLVDKLAGYVPAKDGEKAKGVFRDSLIDNIAAMVDTLKVLNVFDDPVLSDSIGLIERQIASVSPDLLREDAYKRTVISDIAKDILESRLDAKLPKEKPADTPAAKPVEFHIADNLDKPEPVEPKPEPKADDDEDYFNL